mgnify:CR=1 FL=1
MCMSFPDFQPCLYEVFSDSPAFCLLPADDYSGVIYSDETAA